MWKWKYTKSKVKPLRGINAPIYLISGYKFMQKYFSYSNRLCSFSIYWQFYPIRNMSGCVESPVRTVNPFYSVLIFARVSFVRSATSTCSLLQILTCDLSISSISHTKKKKNKFVKFMLHQVWNIRKPFRTFCKRSAQNQLLPWNEVKSTT